MQHENIIPTEAEASGLRM